MRRMRRVIGLIFIVWILKREVFILKIVGHFSGELGIPASIAHLVYRLFWIFSIMMLFTSIMIHLEPFILIGIIRIISRVALNQIYALVKLIFLWFPLIILLLAFIKSIFSILHLIILMQFKQLLFSNKPSGVVLPLFHSYSLIF